MTNGGRIVTWAADREADIQQAQVFHSLLAERRAELCDRLDEQRDRFDALWGLWLTRTSELSEARKLVGELSITATRLDDDALRLQAHHAGWANVIWLGELELAHDHMREGLRIYDPNKHKDHALNYGGHDPGVCCKGQGSLALWLLGYPDQAARSADEAVALAETLKHLTQLGARTHVDWTPKVRHSR